MKSINIWGDWTTSNDIKPRALECLVQKWRVSHKNINFNQKSYVTLSDSEIKNTNPVDLKLVQNHGHHVKCFEFIIENPTNRKYMVLGYWDRAWESIAHFKRLDFIENCVEFFTAQGCFNYEKNLEEHPNLNYTPINKIPWGPYVTEEIESIMKGGTNHRTIPQNMSCRMVNHGYGFRAFLFKDKRFKCFTGAKTDSCAHLKELHENWINIDTYSVSGVSMRLIEGMGLGTAVLSPAFPQKCHNSINPNFHYIEVPFNGNHIPFSPLGYHHDPKFTREDELIHKELADQYYDTFNKVKKDKDLINFISSNGREYYLNHCTIDQYVNQLFTLINLNKLF